MACDCIKNWKPETDTLGNLRTVAVEHEDGRNDLRCRVKTAYWYVTATFCPFCGVRYEPEPNVPDDIELLREYVYSAICPPPSIPDPSLEVYQKLFVLLGCQEKYERDRAEEAASVCAGPRAVPEGEPS